MSAFNFSFNKPLINNNNNINVINNLTTEYSEYNNKYISLYSQANNLLEIKKEKEKENEKLEQEIKNNKLWLANQPLQQDFIEKLQHYLHEKNVNVFSEMLTGLVKDVLEKDKQIDLELYTSHNLPALKIYATQDGKAESIYDGSGGSLTNLVSTGLRIIACNRSGGRKFLILDEADCWIKPDRIPLFAKVIGNVSKIMNMQIIMISHHSTEYFKDYGRVIELSKHADRIEANIISDTDFEEEKVGDNYFSQIRMQNFLSHEDTTIDLHPNITCITGENDIGKSAITAFFKSIVRGDSEDSFIKHDNDQAKGYITLKNGTSIFWQRNKKLNQENKQKVYYELFVDNKSVANAYSSHECPDFISNIFNMNIIDNIDIHITHQKEPTFLIDNKTRPQDKAKILSLGKESLIVQKMMEKLKEKTKQFKVLLKNQEILYHNNYLIINELKDIEKSIEKINEIKELNEELNKNIVKKNNLKLLIKDLFLFKNLSSINKNENINDFTNLELINTTRLKNIIDEIKYYQNILKIKSYEQILLNQEIEDNLLNQNKLSSMVDKLKTYKKLSNISMNNNIPIEEMVNTQELKELIKNLKLNHLINNISKSPELIIEEEVKDLNNLKSLINNIKYYQNILNIDKFIIIQDIEEITNNLNINNQKITAIQNLIDEIKNKQNILSKLKINYEEHIKNYDLLNQEKRKIYDNLGKICPECGSKISIDKLFEDH